MLIHSAWANSTSCACLSHISYEKAEVLLAREHFNAPIHRQKLKSRCITRWCRDVMEWALFYSCIRRLYVLKCSFVSSSWLVRSFQWVLPDSHTENAKERHKESWRLFCPCICVMECSYLLFALRCRCKSEAETILHSFQHCVILPGHRTESRSY